jgi:hypothetical protein
MEHVVNAHYGRPAVDGNITHRRGAKMLNGSDEAERRSAE